MISVAHRPDLAGLPVATVENLVREHFANRGQPSYRGRQVVEWIFDRLVTSFEAMTNLPQAERAALAEAFELTVLDVDRVSRSTDGTAKHLWRLADGELIESVLIPSDNRLTLCISSQAGCAMACTFCATGWMGYERQLTTGEIVGQYRQARAWARENGYDDITNIVFMGMGEPLMNPKAVFPTLEILNHGYGVGARRITISTVGVVPGIDQLADLPEQYRLAVSLHAPNTELRQTLIPLEKKYPLPRLLESLRRFDEAGGKRITFEYVMIDGVNDSLELADELAVLVAEFQAFVNLIPFNPIPGTDWQPTPHGRLKAFAAHLESHGIPAYIRTPRGRDIAAACGQLKAEATVGRRMVQIGVEPQRDHIQPRNELIDYANCATAGSLSSSAFGKNYRPAPALSQVCESSSQFPSPGMSSRSHAKYAHHPDLTGERQFTAETQRSRRTRSNNKNPSRADRETNAYILRPDTTVRLCVLRVLRVSAVNVGLNRFLRSLTQSLLAFGRAPYTVPIPRLRKLDFIGMKRIWIVLLGLVATLLPAVALAGCSGSSGEYPSRPITMIVPWGAGGGTDAVARTIASLMERELGVPINVVTRTGGSGVVGHQAIANAAPDGYTFGIITAEIAMMHHLGLTDLTYEGLTPLGFVNADAAAIQVRADDPYRTLDELLQAVRTSPPRTFQASGTAQGGIWHVALYAMLAEVDIPPANVAWIPSNGTAEGLLDLMAGGVDMVVASHPESRALIDAGRVRSLAILAEAPSTLYPDVPTARDEIGATSMIGVWRGFAAPPGLPDEIRARLETALKNAYDSAEFREFMTNRGFGMRWLGPAEFGEFMAAQDEQMGTTMRSLGMLP